MTPGQAYCQGMLVRVVGHRFVAGLIFDRTTDRVIFAAPILRHLVGAHRDTLRQTFTRLGWRATIVR